MQKVWEHCKGKKICEADEPKDDADPVNEGLIAKGGHGGCGHIQPDVRKEGLKLFLVYKKNSDEDDAVNIPLFSSPVVLPFSTRYVSISRLSGCEEQASGKATVPRVGRVQRLKENLGR